LGNERLFQDYYHISLCPCSSHTFNKQNRDSQCRISGGNVVTPRCRNSSVWSTGDRIRPGWKTDIGAIRKRARWTVLSRKTSPMLHVRILDSISLAYSSRWFARCKCFERVMMSWTWKRGRTGRGDRKSHSQVGRPGIVEKNNFLFILARFKLGIYQPKSNVEDGAPEWVPEGSANATKNLVTDTERILNQCSALLLSHSRSYLTE
jgi:hypothetical protein